VNILSVSDQESALIYSPAIKERFKHIDIIISCGDLPYYYLEYIISSLNKPLYYVRGNHSNQVEYGSGAERTEPWGAIDLHRRICREPGLLISGVEGCLRYNSGPQQYTQAQMWRHVWRLLPGLWSNRLRYGRYLDVFVTHAPPWKVHDQEDKPHQGIKAFNWLIRVFRPALHFHGHIHVYRNDAVTKSRVVATDVINSFGYWETRFDLK
jgi:Icc-related predicted phosphoesterase